MPVNTIISVRKGSSSEWTSANPVLASGELGFDTTNKILKIGDGATPWNSLNNHNHSAEDITTGTVAPARLGSGTANSTTFLRGDQTYATPPVTSVDGATGAVTVTKATVYEFTRSSAPADATGSNGVWTWPLPSGAKILEVICIGGGGGGGSGRRGATNEARFGGGGGGGGGGMIATIKASAITTSLTVVVGSGGGGGASRTTDNTDGASGSAGTSSSVSFNGSQWVIGINGAPGGGGTTTAGTGGLNDSVTARTFSGTNGGAASATGTGATPGSAVGFAGTGGGAGGSINASNTVFAAGSTRQASGASPYLLLFPTSAASVPGGSASTSANATDGPNAPSLGGGGGGGGASANGFASGAGGNGGAGFVRITVWS